MTSRQEHSSPEIGQMPKEWRIASIGELVQYEKGKAPPELYDEEVTESLPYLTVESLRTERVFRWAQESGSTVKVSPEDIIMVWDGFNSGDVFTGFSGILGSTAVKLNSRSHALDNAFLFNFLQTRFRILNGRTAGMYLKHVSKTVFESLQIPLPPLPEQHQITSALSTVDKAIEKSDEIIAKTHQLKKGLMQQLLTRGIGHARFKKTEIGEIADDWVVSTIDLECEVGSGGTPSRDRLDFFGGGIQWVKTTELDRNLIMSTEETITKKGLEHSSAKVYPKGTLLVAMYGLEAPGTRGRCAILGIDAAVNQACAAIQSLGRIQIPFLFYYYQSLGDRIMSLTGGTKRQNLSLEIVKSIKVPLPSPAEQTKITQVLSDIDTKIEREKQDRQGIILLKKGLTQALLTGRVRVKVN